MHLPPLADLRASARVVALPLHTRFRGIDVREALLLEGPEGWAEFSPFVEYDDRESAAWLAAAIEYGWERTPAAVRDTVPVNATVPAVAAASVPEVLARFDGCRTAKVKVAEPGQTLADDVARVREVRAAMGPEGRIRIDANGAWNVDEAEHAVHALAGFDLEYVEQPCATVPELAELRTRIRWMDIPIAADESTTAFGTPVEPEVATTTPAPTSSTGRSGRSACITGLSGFAGTGAATRSPASNRKATAVRPRTPRCSPRSRRLASAAVGQGQRAGEHPRRGDREPGQSRRPHPARSNLRPPMAAIRLPTIGSCAANSSSMM